MSGVLQLDARATVAVPSRATVPVVHTGKPAVLARTAELEALAGRTGQPGAMHGLAYLLEQEYTARKLPHLVCFHAAEGPLVGAVLLFEYRWGRWATGMVATGDRFGVRTVIGLNAVRPFLAREACSAMLRRGSKVVLASFKWSGQMAVSLDAKESERRWATQTRAVRDTLPLASTYEGTLALLGKRTRTHLRYYRRRVEAAVAGAFVPDAAKLLDLDDTAFLTRMNRASLDPIAQTEFNLQIRAAATLSGGFINGLRGEDGRWMALAGGWRQAGTTSVQWQTNASGYEELSLCTALRAFLIEDEVARGTTRLTFHGGTSHSMSHAFEEDRVVDLVAARRGSSAKLVARVVPWVYRRLPALGTRGNLLGDVLSSGRLEWVSGEELGDLFGGPGDAGPVG